LATKKRETDVHLGVQLVCDALTDAFDRAIIITADSDLLPAIRLAHKQRPEKELFVATPPGRYPNARDLQPRFEVRKGIIALHLFPANVINGSGKTVAVRPKEYDP
jgi:hypothetical protein